MSPPDASMDYTGEYGRAFLAIGGENVRKLMISRLAELTERRTDLRAAVYDRFRTTKDPRAKQLLGSVISDAPDEEGVLLLIERQAEDRLPFGGLLVSALHHLAQDEAPSKRVSGWSEIISVPLTSLRRRLFAMTVDGDPRAELAKFSLNTIDDLRDDYGRVEEEPRHPDLASGRPWPLAV